MLHIDGFNIPFLEALLPSKSAKTYQRLLALVDREFPGFVAGKTWVMDYEGAMLKSLARAGATPRVLFPFLPGALEACQLVAFGGQVSAGRWLSAPIL